MSTDRISRGRFLKQSAITGATLAAGADMLTPTVDAASPATIAHSTSEVVEFWDFNSPVGSPSWTKWFNWVKRTFEAQNPGVTVKFQFVPFGDPFIQKVEAAVAAGTPPDVIHSSVAWARDLYDRNALYKMNDFIAKTPATQPSRFFPSATVTDSENGAIFGVPMEGPDSKMILLNTKLVAKTLGWSAKTPQDIMAWPEKVSTWDDLTRLAVALTQRAGNKVKVAGFNVPDLGDLDSFAGLLASNGSSFYKNNLQNVNINTRQALECVQWMLSLQNKYKVSQPLSGQRDDPTELVAGHAAMILADSDWPIVFHNSNPDVPIMSMVLPRGPHAKRKGTISWMNVAAMGRNVKNPALAWKFVQFITSQSTQLYRLQLLGYYAPLRSLYDTPQWKAAELKIPALSQIRPAASAGYVRDFFHHSELNSKVGPLLTKVNLGQLSPQSALAQAQQLGDTILAGI